MEEVTALLNELANKKIKLSVEGGRLNCYARAGMLTDDLKSGIVTHRAQLIALLAAREQDMHRILPGSDGHVTESSEEQCVHHIFADLAVRHADKIAVVCGGEQITYRQLENKSRQLAIYLQARGVGTDQPVGICMERSIDLIVALLAILKAGGAYMPIDPDLPVRRMAQILQDSRPGIVLTQAALKKSLSDVNTADFQLIVMDEIQSETSDHAAGSDIRQAELDQSVRPHHLAYVMYTSGSTGHPKGVLIEHRQIVSYANAIRRKLQISEGSSFAHISTFAADLGNTVLYSSMLGGGTLHVMTKDVMRDPNAYADYCRENQIDYMKITPAHFRALVAEGRERCLVPSRALVFGGDVLTKDVVTLAHAIHPECRIFNHYGPTECTVGVLCGEVDTDVNSDKRIISLGVPLGGSQIYILDSRGQLLPQGESGELYVGGDQVARGYLNQPELTTARFIQDPFNLKAESRMYCTGDKARYLEDGSVEFLGRTDFQVKIRGFRIELGEIEAQLRQNPLVKDAVVIATSDEDAGKWLVAYCTVKDGLHNRQDAEELREYLRVRLPDYMVPGAIVLMGEFPLTANGKIDRKALPEPKTNSPVLDVCDAPQGDVEHNLAKIWADVLRLERIGRTDNFFDLGGHSLLATKLIARLRSRLGIELPYKALFERPNIAELAEVISELVQTPSSELKPIAVERHERLPLSYAQERIWFMAQLQPESAAYNLPKAYVLSGALDIEHLETAFRQIIARHEILRTVFPSENGEPRQLILDHIEFRLRCIDLSGLEDDQRRDREAGVFCQKESIKPFDLTSGPLIRGTVLKLSDCKHILLLNLHHIVGDGWSIDVLTRELAVAMAALSKNRKPEFAPLPYQFADYAVWQRAWLQKTGLLSRQLAYWKTKFSGHAESLDLPADYARPPVQSLKGASHAFNMDAQLLAGMKTLARREGATLYMALLAAFKILLFRYTGQNDICVGTAIATRKHGDTEGLIGMFVNSLALRDRVEGEEPFTSLLSRVKSTCLDAYENQDAPFEKVVEMVRPQRNLAANPLFQVMLNLQSGTDTLDAVFPSYPIESSMSQFDLTVTFTETAEALQGLIEFSTDLFSAATIRRLSNRFECLCRAIVDSPSTQIHEYDLLGHAEKHRVVVEFNATQAVHQEDKCLHELFVEQAARCPEKAAVVCDGQQITYQELYERSRKLALYLQALGVRPDRAVGLCMERTADMVVGILGVLLAGGAYVPLDPSYPEERLAYMIADSQAELVLTQERLQSKVARLSGHGTQLIQTDRQWQEIEACAQAAATFNVDLDRIVRPHHLAYLIYTSGSTGKPKGVAIEHHSPVTLVRWASEVYSAEELEGTLGSTSICFDLSIFEIFVTLANGGTIVLMANALALGASPNNYPVTLINTAPTVMEQLLRAGEIPKSVRTINLAGEPLSPALVDSIYESTSVTKVYDLYGPSEDTTYSTWTWRKKNSPATIGRPIANTQVYILDSRNKPQPIGVPGELYIAGDGLARGYLNRPELTREKFVDNPFTPGQRMYKTGDLARWRGDGNIQFLGRIDTQIKIRGLRVELGEIESQLGQHPAIEANAVIAKGQGLDRHMVAFYRAKQSTQNRIVEVPYEDLRAHLLRTLPDYMVPRTFVSIASIPLNPSGKVDRRSLEALEAKATSSRKYVEPINQAEKQLVQVWAEVLKVDPENVGTHDNFFELGGHSLLATQLIASIRNRLNVEMPLKALFEHPTISLMAELISSSENAIPLTIRPVDRAQVGSFPLSFSQERLWFISQMEHGNTSYNLPVALSISGPLSIGQLEEALNQIIERHEILRTVFPSDEGRPHQVILDKVDLKIDRIDWNRRAGGDQVHDLVSELFRKDAVTPFDLAQGPLLRGHAIELAEGDYILMLNMHHIVTDGWSMGVLIAELDLILDAFRIGREPVLEPLPIQYVDYAIWQRTRLEAGGLLKKQLDYWRRKLAGLPESINLLTDYPRPSVQSFSGVTHPLSLDYQLAERLKTLAQHKGGTLYMALLAAVNVLLYRYTGQTDVCIGIPIANRQFAETANLLGILVNTLAVRSQLDGEDTFSAFLSQVKNTCLEAYENQDTPFEKVVDMLQPRRNMASTPLFQVMVVLENMPAVPRHIRRCPLDSGISKFDLTFQFTESGEGLSGSIEYSTALFSRGTITRMAGHFESLCRAIVATPTARIRDLDYLGAAEREQVLRGFNATSCSYPSERCLHDFFVDRALLCPTAVAARYGQSCLTYGELYERSGALGVYLQSLGVCADAIVGVCVERSLEMMVALVGSVRAGAAYLPADPDYPDDRLEYMLHDSGARVVLTQHRFSARLRRLLGEDVKLICLDAEWGAVAAASATLNAQGVHLQSVAGPRNLCYLIYTSGSTGRPKGVVVEHRAVVNRLYWMQSRYNLGADDVVLQKTPYSFDVSVWEFFWPLMTGASVVFAAPGGHKDVEYLEALINQAGVTTLHFVPSMLHSFIESARGSCGGVRQIFCSGEALDKHSVDRYRTRFANASLHNLYGPTEAAIDVTACDCSDLKLPFVPIGAPIANTQIYILDAYNQPQPIGVPGQLHIAGDGLARGYLNRPELTREKFVDNPFTPGQRMYKTGDLARWLEDGNIQYLGRMDTQVKIRGLRIELGEIEACLNQHPQIEDSVVVARNQGADRQLVAFYRARKTQARELVQLDSQQLRAHVLRTLPDYMMPAAFVSVAEIPLSTNGKVDRAALERMPMQAVSDREFVPPGNDTERQLAEIWAEVLKLEPAKIGIHDNFFELGGHSLLAVPLMAKIDRRFKRLLPLSTMFATPSIAALAALLSKGAHLSSSILVAIRPNGNEGPVFGVPGAGGNVVSLRPLTKALSASRPFYGLEAVGLDGKSQPHQSVEQTAQANIVAMKSVQPQGPYRLIGHSYGGVVAFEMARILLEQHEQVASLVLLDSIAPGSLHEVDAVDEAEEFCRACAIVSKAYAIDLRVDVERLRLDSTDANIRYVVGLLREQGVEIRTEQVDAFYTVYRANVSSYRAYKPVPLTQEIDASLYRALRGRRDGATMQLDYGWNHVLQNPIRTYDVDADHFSMLEVVRLDEPVHTGGHSHCTVQHCIDRGGGFATELDYDDRTAVDSNGYIPLATIE